jgi:ribonuclease HI
MGLQAEGATRKEVAVKEEPKKGLIIYTDGGCRPKNPGNAGWGIHGYLYDAVKPKKGSGLGDHFLTNHGYLSREDAGKRTLTFVEYTTDVFMAAIKNSKTDLLEVTPTYYVNGFGSFLSEQTNNVAELTATIEGLKFALEHGVDVVEVWTDSEYVRRGVEDWLPGWIRNNFIRPDLTEVKNKKEWQELLSIREQLKNRGTHVQVRWIRSHMDSMGNTEADHAATAGVIQSMRNRSGFNKDAQQYSSVSTEKAEGYWKYDSERHPFIALPRMYFNTKEEYMREGEYYFGTHGKDDDHVGKRISDGAYSVVILKEKDHVLEMVRSFCCRYAEDGDNIMFARLDQLYNPTIHRELTLFNDNAMVPVKNTSRGRLSLETTGAVPLVDHVDPPLLAYRAVDCVTEMLGNLQQFLANDPRLVRTDITDILYETVEKPTKKGTESFLQLKAEYNVGFASLNVVANYQLDDSVQTAPVTLTLGIDLLTRNSLKRLETTSPKVTLITWAESADAFRYATVIQSGEDVGIWAGYYSNLRIVSK